MNLLDIAEPALLFQTKDSVSKVASAMYRKKRYEALVFEGKKCKGMLSARELVKRNVNDPDKTKISGLKALLKPLQPFTPESDPNEVIDFILLNDYTSAPVLSGEKYFTITKLHLLKTLSKVFFKNKNASDALFFPNCISPEDPLSVAQSIFRQTHLYQLAIINQKGRADRIIDTLDFLRIDVDRKRMRKGEKAGEKIKVREVLASSPVLMQPPLKVIPSTPLREVMEKMIESNDPMVVVEDEKFKGIITPSSILKLREKKIAGIYVRLSGQQKEDTFIKSVIDEQIRNEIRKLGKFIPIDYMVLHIDRYKETGKRRKYSVKGRLITEKGMFFADDHAWDVTQAIRGVLAKLEREVLKKKEKKLRRR